MAPVTTTAPVGSADLRALAEAEGLGTVGRRPGLWAYTKSLWAHRDFILTMARSGLRAKNSRNRLGSLWLILTPLLQGLVYYFVFGLLLGVSRDVENFVGFLVVGVIFFQHVAQNLTTGAKAVVQNRKLVQALSFPRAALPIASVLRATLGFLPALVVVFVIVTLSWLPEVRITWRWVLVVPIVLLMMLFNFGLVLLFSRWTSHTEDVGNVLPLFVRVWLYTSGVFFPVEQYAANNPQLLAILTANPMHIILTLARDALVYGVPSEPRYWWGMTAWAVGLFVVGYVAFWQAEERYTRD